MKTLKIFFISIFFLSFFSCQEEEKPTNVPFVIGFKDPALALEKFHKTTEVELVFSKKAASNGSVDIKMETNIPLNNITTPITIEDNHLHLNFNSGENQLKFPLMVKKADIPTDAYIELKVQNIEYNGATAIQGYTSLYLSYSDLIGGSLAPEIGGPNEPYQVYVDIPSGKTTQVERNSWDLAFYSTDNYVKINSSIYMAAKQKSIGFDDWSLSDVTEEELTEVAVGTFDDNNKDYVDHPSGNLDQTAIKVGTSEDTAPTYLVNLGFNPGTQTPPVGHVMVSGPRRGHAKVKIWTENDMYVLKYQLKENPTIYLEKITKNEAYNFTFFNLLTNTVKQVEPEKDKWNLCFTVFTTLQPGAGSYGFSDYVIHNRYGNTVAAKMEDQQIPYTNMNLEQAQNLTYSKNLTTIGSHWRSVFNGGTVFDNVYFIVKIGEEKYYKIRFLTLTNENGVRGYPSFKFEKL